MPRSTQITTSGGIGVIALSKLQTGNYSGQLNPAAPAGIAGTTYKMLGLGSTFAFTPNRTGKVWYALLLGGSNTTLGDTCFARFRYGTGAAPANGDALTGTEIFATDLSIIDLVANSPEFVTVSGFVSALLTVNTAYWFDVALKSSGAASTAKLIAPIFGEFAEFSG